MGVSSDLLGLTSDVKVTPTIQSPEKTKIYTVGGLNIVLNDVQVTDIGWNPFGLESNLALVVNTTETSGNLDGLSVEEVWFTDNQGNKLPNQAIEKGVDSTGMPTFCWTLWISKKADGYFLHFPTGEVIDFDSINKLGTKKYSPTRDSQKTGLNWRTLQSWSNNKITRFDSSIIISLCEYFNFT